MIIARITFKPEFASQFCEGKNQTVVETTFESGADLMVTVKEFEPYIEDCIAMIISGTRVIGIRKAPSA